MSNKYHDKLREIYQENRYELQKKINDFYKNNEIDDEEFQEAFFDIYYNSICTQAAVITTKFTPEYREKFIKTLMTDIMSMMDSVDEYRSIVTTVYQMMNKKEGL